MIPVEFSTALFVESAEQRRAIPQQPAAPLGPRAVVPWGRLPARQGGGHRAFSRWRTRDDRSVLPRGPARPRLWRLFRPPQDGTRGVWAAPTGRGVSATSGRALLHPSRAGRSPQPSGRTGVAPHRWRGAGQRCRLRQQGGCWWLSAVGF